MTTETITWFKASTEGINMPDAFELVLLDREEGGEPVPVAPGYWDGEFWQNTYGEMMTGKVTGWAAWPKGRNGGAAC